MKIGFLLQPSKELQDVKAFCLLMLALPAVWFCFLGWDGESLLAGNDALLESLVYREVLNVSGDWSQLLWNPQIFGGTLFHGLFPTPVFSRIWGSLHLSPILAYNISHFLIQALIGFLGAEIVFAGAKFWQPGARPIRSWWLQAIVIALLCFQPTLAWRLGWGHQNFISGLLVMVGVSFLLLVQKRTYFLTFLAWLALLQGLSSLGQQLSLNYFYFCLPVVCSLLPASRNRLWLNAGLILFSAILWVLPANMEILRTALSGDARSLLRSEVVYSYLVGTWNDLATFFFLDPHLISSRKDGFLFHEAHYYFGIYAFGFLILFWHRNWKSLLILSLSCVALISLALNLQPLSGLLIHLPFLGGLRTPLRGFLPMAFLLSLVTLAWVVSRVGDGENTRFFNGDKVILIPALILFCALGFVLEAWGREVYWLLLFVSVVLVRTRMTKFQNFQPLVLVAMVVVSVFAFSEKLVPALSRDAFEAQTKTPSIDLLKQQLGENWAYQRLASPQMTDFRANRFWAMGLSGLDGYFSAPSRLGQLFAASAGIPYQASISNLWMSPQLKDFSIFRDLYQICCLVENFQAELFQVQHLSKSTEAAWFVHQMKESLNFQSLLGELRNLPTSPSQTWQVAFLLPESSARLVREVSADCVGAQVQSVQHVSRQEFWIDYDSPAECPLILSMNFNSLFQAKVDSQAVELFPANGVLMAVLVPSGKHQLQIELKSWFSPGLRWLFGFFSLAFFFWGLYRMREDT